MIFIKRRAFCYFDWMSFLLILALLSIGLIFIFSATMHPEQPISLFFKKQFIGALSGIGIYFLCSIIDYRTLWRLGFILYFVVIGMLLFTFLKGSLAMGAQRWINLGIVRFQPSELAKLFFPAFFSYYFFEEGKYPSHIIDFVPILIILVFSTLLILKQPDLGTALILLFSGTILLWLMGIGKKFFLWAFIFLALSAPLAWTFLKPYQKQRIAVFLGYGDVHKERYQIEQSVIAIGSGGICGKGFLKGTQNKLQFLPESRTDFIFSVICEEGGFLTALLILLLYITLFVRLLWQTKNIIDPFIHILALGLIIHIILSTIINIGMVTGVLPIVGIPLPLMSYGLSNLWITLASLGWLQSIAMPHQ